MKQMLDQDEAKRDWMLSALVSRHPNLVDNMTTKGNLTFAQLKVRMHSLSSNITRRAGSALVVNTQNREHHQNDRKSYFGSCWYRVTSAITSLSWNLPNE